MGRERSWSVLIWVEARESLFHLPLAAWHHPLPVDRAPSAPRHGLPISGLDLMRDCILCLCIHGGLTGMPQVSMPSAAVGGAPVGLSILGARGSDATLVAVARALSIEPKA